MTSNHKNIENDLGRYINPTHLGFRLEKLASRYAKANPFPHTVIDNFLFSDRLSDVLAGFDNVDWAVYSHFNEKKSGNKSKEFDPRLQNTIDALNSDHFLKWLEKLTGISGLIADPELGSGGVHRSTRDGFLNIHADFTTHPYKKSWHRRINVLVYLSEEWDENWGGALELWDSEMKGCVHKIAPVFNRCVIFNTDYDSFHGHPEPMTCPEGIWRKSIALYYYTLADENVRSVATNYKGRPKDNLAKKLLIFADKSLISVFHFLKGRFKISDNVATTIFGLFSRK